jgi:hypothetical protein
MRPYLENTEHKKRTGGVAQGEGPEFKTQYHKKIKIKNKASNAKCDKYFDVYFAFGSSGF